MGGSARILWTRGQGAEAECRGAGGEVGEGEREGEGSRWRDMREGEHQGYDVG